MLKIALCDDEPRQCQAIETLLAAYSKTGITVQTYTDGLSLCKQVQWLGKTAFDIYLLDVIMPQVSGIELGQRLRRLGIDAPIIYLTTSKDYAVESYTVQAFHYLIKPIQKEALFSVLAKAENHIAQTKSHCIPVHTPDGIVMVNISDVLYVELYARCAAYHLGNGTVVHSQKLRIAFKEAVGDLTKHRSFIMMGSSFLINLRYVKKINSNSILLTDGTVLQIPKGTVKQQLVTQWMEYWLGGA